MKGMCHATCKTTNARLGTVGDKLGEDLVEYSQWEEWGTCSVGCGCGHDQAKVGDDERRIFVLINTGRRLECWVILRDDGRYWVGAAMVSIVCYGVDGAHDASADGGDGV